MTPHFRLGSTCAFRPPIHQTLAGCPANDAGRALRIVNAQPRAVVIPEIKFRHVTVQMVRRAVLIDTGHASLEHAVEGDYPQRDSHGGTSYKGSPSYGDCEPIP